MTEKLRNLEEMTLKTWKFDYNKGLEAKEVTHAINSISEIMKGHSWEKSWSQMGKPLKNEILKNFLEKVNGDMSCYSNYYQLKHELQKIYMEIRKNELPDEQNKKIFIDRDRFMELERKVELLWLAPNMPGCMEEINAVSQSFCTTDDK